MIHPPLSIEAAQGLQRLLLLKCCGYTEKQLFVVPILGIGHELQACAGVRDEFFQLLGRLGDERCQVRIQGQEAIDY